MLCISSQGLGSLRTSCSDWTERHMILGCDLLTKGTLTRLSKFDQSDQEYESLFCLLVTSFGSDVWINREYRHLDLVLTLNFYTIRLCVVSQK
ncbi:hypothetical protein [Absidia glauca]|uniref:Uncharacterized protein n=1 Tax=Absidia glauca TaxID=4829 RepID=A0A168LDP9_ABSGL|nr:hypothetical protein [Absidia glauca]